MQQQLSRNMALRVAYVGSQNLYIANLALTHPGAGKVSVLGVPFPGAPIAH